MTFKVHSSIFDLILFFFFILPDGVDDLDEDGDLDDEEGMCVNFQIPRFHITRCVMVCTSAETFKKFCLS